MSFLFGKKNKGDKGGGAPPTRDGAPSAASQNSVPTTNGIRPRGPSGISSPGPGPGPGPGAAAAGNSIDGSSTPTQDASHDQRGGNEQEGQVRLNFQLLSSHPAIYRPLLE